MRLVCGYIAVGSPMNHRRRYHRILWGDELDGIDLGRCNSVVANVGQWALSKASLVTPPEGGQPTEHPWSPSHYLRQVDRMAQHMHAAQRAGKRVWWVTIGAHGYIDRFVNRTDFRTDPWLLLFNSLAYTTMHHYGIPVIDTYSMQATFPDLSYDGAHFKGAVGHWAAAAVAHDLCSDDHPSYPAARQQPPAEEAAGATGGSCRRAGSRRGPRH
jgi:hypothetical protein